MNTPAFIRRHRASLALIPLCLLLLAMAGAPLRRAFLSMRYPFQLDYAEGFLAVEAWQISKGESIYPSLKDYPYLVGNYPPIFPLMQAPFFMLFGPSLFWGRFFVFLAGCAIAALIAFIVYRQTGLWLPALAAPLLFWNTYALYEWVGYARVDLPAVFFSLCGLAVLMRGEGRKRLAAASLLFIVSIYTKQIQVFALAAAGLYLFCKNRPLGLRFIVANTAAILIIFALLCLFTRGEYFRHTVIYNANEFQWWQVKVWTVNLLLKFYPIYLTTLFLFAATNIMEREKGGWGVENIKPRDLFAIYALLGAASFLAIGKVGAAANYLIEFHAALAVFAGISLGGMMNTMGNGRRLPMILFACAAILLTLHAMNLTRLRRLLFSRPNPDAVSLEKGQRLLEIVRDFPEPVYSEQPVINLLAGRDVLFQPFIMSQLARESKWNESPFLKDIEARRFSLVITGQDITQEGFKWQYTPAMQEAFGRAYRPLLPSGNPTRTLLESPSGGIPYFVYVPKE